MPPYSTLLAAELALAAITVVALRFVVAPYGRHARPGWGPTVSARWGWVCMEAPASLVMAAAWASGDQAFTLVPTLLLVMWQSHYFYRAFIYPWSLSNARPMPWAVVVMGASFNLLNGSLNGLAVSQAEARGAEWLADPRFWLGLILFVGGAVINRRADATLRSLRAPGETGYKLPQGGLFRWVSCPNYLGELVEWCGWALASGSLAGLAFAIYSAANLVPRAIDHHRWYKERFGAQVAKRRAILPFLL